MKPFEAGKRGFRTNAENPYQEGSHNYKEWERGYNQEYFSNLSGGGSQGVQTKKEAREYSSDFS
jgi:hypothetical protein